MFDSDGALNQGEAGVERGRCFSKSRAPQQGCSSSGGRGGRLLPAAPPTGALLGAQARPSLG